MPRPLTFRLPVSLLPLLTVGLVVVTTVTPLAAQAATIDVTNCNDSGEGSLRAAIGRAASGDTIDLSNAGCSKVQLTSGTLTIPQADLTLRGAGAYRTAINGGYADSILRHTGSGLLKLERLTVEEGRLRNYNRSINNGRALGGCIRSTGPVSLTSVEVHHCIVDGVMGSTGAGIYSETSVSLQDSSVYSARAYGDFSYGGAVYAEGKISADLSRLMNSSAANGAAAWGNRVVLSRSVVRDNSTEQAISGPIVNGHTVAIASSTMSNNRSGSRRGGGLISALGGLDIVGSTISGNHSAYDGSYTPPDGMEFSTAAIASTSTRISNSTIVGNTVTSMRDGHACDASTVGASNMHLESSIIAHTSCDGVPASDVLAPGSSTREITGANNLVIRVHPSTVVPADTLSADPRLQPLADNGGFTPTHAPDVGSPVLDKGNNAASLSWDQRGRGFSRVKNGRADIGAYER